MILSRRVAVAVGGTAAAAVIGTAGVAMASAPSPSGSPGSPAPSASATAVPDKPDHRGGRDRPGHRHGPLHRLGAALHGEFVVKDRDGKFVTMVSARGEVTAVSATSITIEAEDGFIATFVINGDTRVRGRDVDDIADIKVGDQGGAVGVKSGDTITARAVVVRK
jgi:hypothetical protein